MEFGTPVDVVMTKWRDRPHWAYPARFLGRDRHGDWLGIPAGTHMSRPGADYVSPVNQVALAPTTGPAEASGWFAAFHDRSADGTGSGLVPSSPVDVYVDIATQPVWEGSAIRSVDLDLDVVRGHSGRVWIDDEDEFAEHRVTLDYPDEIVRLAVANCDLVQAAVRDRVPPYDGTTSDAWLARVPDLPA